MKYKQSKKQNQRIEKITDSTLVIGADVAQETHVTHGIDFRGLELVKTVHLVMITKIYKDSIMDEGASAAV